MRYHPLVDNAENPVLRSVITGAIASAVASSTVNIRKVKNEEITKSDAVREVVKRTSQGAIATGAAVATAGHLTQKGGFLKALTTISIGVAGVYALEVIDEKFQEKYIPASCENENLIDQEK